MAAPRKRTLTRKPKDDARPPPKEPTKPFAALDLGASAVRLIIAEGEGDSMRIIEEASRGVLIGKDAFTSGRIGQPTVEAVLKAMEGFRAIMDTFGVVRYRAVATSALREATNRDTVLDRIRVRTGIDVEVIDGSEENRLTYLAIRESLKSMPEIATETCLVAEVGGGSADLSTLQGGEPAHSGTYAIGSIRLRQSFAAFQGTPAHFQRLILRHIENVIADIRRELPLDQVKHFIALGADARLVARVLGSGEAQSSSAIPREAFLRVCGDIAAKDVDTILGAYSLSQAEAETLTPALLVYSELVRATKAGHHHGFERHPAAWPDLRSGALRGRARARGVLPSGPGQRQCPGGEVQLRRQARAPHRLSCPCASSTNSSRSTASIRATAFSSRSPPSSTTSACS